MDANSKPFSHPEKNPEFFFGREKMVLGMKKNLPVTLS
jgi:hypothetical protein